MLAFLRNLDKRWIFLLVLITVGSSVLVGLQFPEKPSPGVIRVFNAIDDLPAGSKVLIALDADPAGAGELQPMASAFVRHCALKRHKMCFMTTWPQATPVVQDTVAIVDAEFPEYEYGVDYVNLGFRSGEEGVIKLVKSNLKEAYGTDDRGLSTAELELTSGLENVGDFDLIVSVSAGFPGTKEWIQYAATPLGIPIIAGNTGVQSPSMRPYVPDQLIGVLPGIKGASEYEMRLIEVYPEMDKESSKVGRQRMGAQVVAHIFVILLIVVGNVVFFLDRKLGGANS